MLTLTVINDMLGTLGEAPLNSIDESHAFRGACLSTLDTADRSIQAAGWWYNMEQVTLQPSSADQGIYLPSDTIAVRSATADVVQRGTRLYNLDGGTYVFTDKEDLVLIRRVPFEQLPESAAIYIAATAVLNFQTRYDGDTARTRELSIAVERARIAANIDHTRNRRTNLIESNVRLQRIKSFTYRVRRF